MSTAMTKPSQRAAVAEGLALGIVALRGHGFSFIAQKMRVEFAFQHAWRDWSFHARFPAIRAEISRNDLLGIIDSHPRQVRGTHLAGWNSTWPFTPYIADDYDLDEVAGLLEETTGVSLTGWTDLAHRFLSDLERDYSIPEKK